jgi:hypothetical protein
MEGLFCTIKLHKQADKHILLTKKRDSRKKALSLRRKWGGIPCFELKLRQNKG